MQRGHEPKRHHIHSAPSSRTTITQIVAKTLQSHIMAKSRRETQENVISNVKNKLVLD